MISGGQEQKSETGKEREPGVYVFLPEESDPFIDFDVDPVCDTEIALSRICKKLKVAEGYLSKRGKTKELAVKTLSAGNYDFHITERVSQQGK